MMQQTAAVASTTRRPVLVSVGLIAALLAIASVCVSLANQPMSRTLDRGADELRNTREKLQVLTKPFVTVMGADSLNKGFNFFRGRGADAGIARAIGQFTVTQHKTLEYGSTVYLQPDQMDVTMNAQCRSSQSSSSTYSSYSLKQAASLAEQSSFGMDASVSGSVSYGLASASGGMDVGVFFGNSFEMKTASSMAAQGYGFASDSYVESTLFNAFVDWQTPEVRFEFYKSMKNFVKTINSHKSKSWKQRNLKVFRFFERFGSHVIREATFGSKCSMTTFMQSTATDKSRSTFMSEAENNDFSMGIWGSFESPTVDMKASLNMRTSNAYQASSYYSGTFGNKQKYEVRNVQCSGHVEDNLCNKQFNAKTDNPVMINYLPWPIWDVPGVGLNTNGKKMVKLSLDDFVKALKKCNKNQCKNAGVCTTKASFWEVDVWMTWDGDFSSKKVTDKQKSILWNKQCVCNQGKDCIGKLIKTPRPTRKPTPKPTSYVSAFKWVRSKGKDCAYMCKTAKTTAGKYEAVVTATGFVACRWSCDGMRGGYNLPSNSKWSHVCGGGCGGKEQSRSTFDCLCGSNKKPVTITDAHTRNCVDACKLKKKKPIVSGKWSRNKRKSFHMCMAHIGSGYRAGYNLGSDKSCVVGYGGKETGKGTFKCMCE